MTDEATPVRARRTKRYIRLVAINLAVLGLLLVVIEGAASYTLFVHRVLSTRPLAERLHTEYDPELGWVNKPNVRIPDMYGPGIALTTNSQRIRSDHDFGKAEPPGKVRAVCSGDSFTLGYGVDDHHTWCHLLSVLDPRIETVNMGQGGYGVDQAYLWYMRDGLQFDHHLHIVTVITDDFRRMQMDSFLGYPKPILAVEAGHLVVRHVPVTRPARYQIWLSDLTRRARELRSVDLTLRVFARLGSGSPGSLPAGSAAVDDETRKVVAQVLRQLQMLHQQQGRRLIVVYLPVESELGSGRSNGWLRFMQTTARDLDIPFVNVVESFRTLPAEEAASLFIHQGTIAYAAAAGHLNDSGNRRVAEIVSRALHGANQASPEKQPATRSVPRS